MATETHRQNIESSFIPPEIMTQPIHQAVNIGGKASFTALASGLPAPTVQWQFCKAGSAVWVGIEGATSTTYTTATLTVADNGKKYRAIFSNSAGRAISNSAVLTILSVPTAKSGQSILFDETKTMERQRRIAEQQQHRKLAKVHAREHNDEEQNVSPEEAMENGILQHPFLNSQRNDGIDPNLNPEPPLNTEARREFDNERREQEMEKQLRLGNMPKMRTDPQFRP
ncbi:immunoglobulin domain-containing protein [Legionella lansingensis]|nr:immunoglobulin domain-containing protein [Legionella lansingensis]